MAVNKRYVANNRQSLVLVLVTGESQMSIEFKPGYGLRNEGYFLTNDLKVQQMLEKDSRYNKSYRLAEIDNMDIAEYIARNCIKDKENETPKEAVNDDTKIFTTSQEAKDWLNKEYKVPFNQITNKKKIIDKALELGFKIEFENENN